MKIVVLDAFGMNPGDFSWEPLRAFGDLEVYQETDNENRELVASRIADCEILLNSKIMLDREVLAHAKKLRYIGVTATGYNNIDLDTCRQRGITVTNVPGYGTEAVAQHTIALLLEACCQVGLHANLVRQGRWEESQRWCFWDRPLTLLSGKTMGIIGYGAIGKAVGRIAQALGMQLLVNARTVHPELETPTLRYASQDEIFEQADVISLHCPLSEDTYHLIDRDRVKQMKEGVFLLNASRGALISEDALVEGLESGKIRYAGLDVTEEEPLPSTSRLLEFEQCFITPHIAWVPVETRHKLFQQVIANVQNFLEGHPTNIIVAP